jgi:hypothetical protein
MFESLKLLPPKILSFDGEVLGILGFAAGGLVWFILPSWINTSGLEEDLFSPS